MRLRISLPALLALTWALGATGCAARATMDARYQASLLRWQGATRAELEAAWGRPTLVQLGPDGQVLTWMVRMDVDGRAAPGTTPIVAVARTAGSGGPTVTTVSPAMVAPAAVPITCTTHFVLKDGRVASWMFEGLGCGAPT